jgi:hypothetical protein
VAFVDTEGIAENLAVREGDVAGQGARFEIAEEELDGVPVIPMQIAAPGAALFFKQGAHLRGVEVAQVADVELDCGCHFRWMPV